MSKGIANGKYDGFIALSVAPHTLDLDVVRDNVGVEWSEDVGREIHSRVCASLGAEVLKFKEITDEFYYFKRSPGDVSLVGYLIDSYGGGLGCGAGGSYLSGGEVCESEQICIATYDFGRVSSELERILLSEESRGVSVRLFRLCGISSVDVDIEDLSELESSEGLLLNELSQRVAEEELGDDVEGYVYKGGVVSYQTWSDGELGDEGCIDNPEDEDWRFEPNDGALVTLFSGIIGGHLSD